MTVDLPVREWLEFGEHDLLAARHLMTAYPVPWEIVAYHLQQAAEKHLKAGLASQNLAIPKTHDLLRLNRLLAEVHPAIAELEDDCDRLTDYGTVTRYPQTSITLDEPRVRTAQIVAERICNSITKWLTGSPSSSPSAD